jgi:chitin synthase
MAEVAMPTRQEDVDALWGQARQELRVPEKEVREKRSAETKRSDRECMQWRELVVETIARG